MPGSAEEAWLLSKAFIEKVAVCQPSHSTLYHTIDEIDSLYLVANPEPVEDNLGIRHVPYVKPAEKKAATEAMLRKCIRLLLACCFTPEGATLAMCGMVTEEGAAAIMTSTITDTVIQATVTDAITRAQQKIKESIESGAVNNASFSNLYWDTLYELIGDRTPHRYLPFAISTTGVLNTADVPHVAVRRSLTAAVKVRQFNTHTMACDR